MLSRLLDNEVKVDTVELAIYSEILRARNPPAATMLRTTIRHQNGRLSFLQIIYTNNSFLTEAVKT